MRWLIIFAWLFLLLLYGYLWILAKTNCCQRSIPGGLKQDSMLDIQRTEPIIFCWNSDSASIANSRNIYLDSFKAEHKKDNNRIQFTRSTVDDGTEEETYKLFKDRALSLKRYFVSKGVGTIQISSEYIGEKNPMNSNSTEFGRFRNRRSELEILN
ncbi:MAG: OmpA family protein [Saprospiraceae bacterium]